MGKKGEVSWAPASGSYFTREFINHTSNSQESLLGIFRALKPNARRAVLKYNFFDPKSRATIGQTTCCESNTDQLDFRKVTMNELVRGVCDDNGNIEEIFTFDRPIHVPVFVSQEGSVELQQKTEQEEVVDTKDKIPLSFEQWRNRQFRKSLGIGRMEGRMYKHFTAWLKDNSEKYRRVMPSEQPSNI